MPTRTNSGHVRVHGSLLAAAEKRALVWMAERMPGWVNSDHLTLLGLGAMLAAGLPFWAASANPLALWAVVAALAVNWFGDSLDGTLARVRDQQRPMYGHYVDHVIDIVGAFFLLGAWRCRRGPGASTTRRALGSALRSPSRGVSPSGAAGRLRERAR